MEEWISIFGPVESLLFDRGPIVVGIVVAKMAEGLIVCRVKASLLDPQANKCVERWNRSLTQDLAFFCGTGDEERDAHVALA